MEEKEINLKIESQLISEEEAPVIVKPADDEVIILPSQLERFFMSYLNLRAKNEYFKISFHVLAFASFVTIGFNTPLQLTYYPYLDMSCFVIYLLTFLLYLFDSIAKMKIYGLVGQEQSFLTNKWNIIQVLMSIFLLASASFQILQIMEITFYPYIIQSCSRIPLSLILILMIPDYVNLDLGEVFTPDALAQMGKVLFFSVYFYIIFALLGIQLVGSTDGICLLNTTTVDNIGEMQFSIPFLHCNLINPDYGYKCPDGFSCFDQETFQINDGNLYFANLFDGIMFVYQGSILDGWSTNFLYSLQSCGVVISSIFYVALVLFSAWLVRNVFVAVVTQILSGALMYEPPHTDYDLASANFGLNLFIDGEKIELRDVSDNAKVDNSFGAILKILLNSVFWKTFISLLIIADICVLAFIGILYPWQITLAIIFILEPILKIIAISFKALSISEWIVYEFLMPTLNVIAVILNIFGYYQLDVIYALRVIRIISVHDIVFDYIKRILGNYARFAAAVLLAVLFLIILSSLSLQLFVGIETISDPTTAVLVDFPTSFFDIFLIFLQGGAFSTMLGLAGLVSYNLSFFVVLFFVGCHFFSNTIMMSVFITFILANLELTEEEIKEMQKEITVVFEPLDDYSGGSIETLKVRLSDELTDDFVIPTRFKIYRKFKNSPPTAIIPVNLREEDFPNVNKNFMTEYLSDDYPVYDERLYIATNIAPTSDATQKYFFAKNFGFTDDEFVPKYFKLEGEVLLELVKILNTRTSPLHTPTMSTKKMPVAQIMASKDQGENQSSEEKEILILQQKITDVIQMRQRAIYYLREQHPTIDKTLFIFSQKNPVRRIVGLILNAHYVNKDTSSSLKEILSLQTYFEWLMILLTFASSIFMMLETTENMVFDNLYSTIFEYIYISINLFEIILKMISQGLILTPSAICNDASGILNICLGVLGIIHAFYFWNVSPTNKFITLTSYSSFAIFLRITRCIRPFKLVLISRNLFRVIVLLVSGWKNVAKVFCLLIILLLFFSYFGYLSFNGRLTRCNDDSVEDLSECSLNFQASLSSAPIVSSNPNYISDTFSIIVPRNNVSNLRFIFDNFGEAYFSSYILLTLDSWDAGMDYIGSLVGTWVKLYFYAYVFFANLIGVSMFVGVVCQSYNINTGVALLTKDQRNWSDLTQRIELTSTLFIPERPINKCRAGLYDVVMSLPYRIIHSMVICISPAVLMTYSFNSSSNISDQDQYIMIILACHGLFLLDMLLKIISFGILQYLRGTVNKCDVVLTLAMTAICILKLLPTYKSDVILNYVIIALVTIELILLSTRWDALKDLMLTFVMSVIKSLTAIAVMFIIMVVYALIGNVLFGRTKFGLTINRYFNFRTSFQALYILLILATGDNWSAYYLDTAIGEPFCTYDSNFPVQTDCGTRIGSIVYIVSYSFILQQILLNLFIATVLSNFAVFCASDDVNGRFKPSNIPSFVIMWGKYDQLQQSEISRTYARMLCLEYFNSKNFTSTDDIFILFQLYEEIDRNIKAKYQSMETEQSQGDNYKVNGKIGFRDLMLILATRLTDIRASFKTNDLLSRLLLEEEIAENVSSSLIAKWYSYIKSQRKKDQKTGDDFYRTIRLATERPGQLQDAENVDPLKSKKFDQDLLRRELDQINAESPTTGVEQIEEFCGEWLNSFIKALEAKKMNMNKQESAASQQP